ncbi:protein ALP1-like [Juglans regia]|uniref:Protein ALP1-like n=1 Tax=Juglans regia TaxID=51240 RepID=A0A6P9EEY8_JUGRE|nr:protein ALP1-like [Juglans regia]
MDHETSSAKTRSIETNSEIDDTSSSISHNSEVDEFMRTYPSSGDEAAMQEVNLINVMYSTSQSWGRRVPMPHHNIGLRGDQYIQAVLNGNPASCKEMFRMEVPAFRYVCDLLRGSLIMDPTERVSVEESLGIFCLLVGHAQGQRIVGDRFQHSSETINRHVVTVMRSLHELGRTVIRPTHTHGVHPYIAGNHHNYPWFEKCLGALDGTMISASAPARRANAYRNRYNRIAQNVLCLCDFDMKFTYVYTGWEGTAHDARVFLDALSRARNGFPWPDPGYYYLVDSAFPCIEKFMPPYPRERYHRSDRYGARQFRGYKDYFNFRHSSLRNVIERTFALLKNQFQILEAMPRYRPSRQGMIVTACCTLHNLIKTVMPNDEYIQRALGLQLSGGNTPEGEDVDETEEVVDMSHESAGAMAAQRDGIGIPMWAHRNGG